MTAKRHYIPHGADQQGRVDPGTQAPRVPRNVICYGTLGALLCAVSAVAVAFGIARLIWEFWP